MVEITEKNLHANTMSELFTECVKLQSEKPVFKERSQEDLDFLRTALNSIAIDPVVDLRNRMNELCALLDDYDSNSVDTLNCAFEYLGDILENIDMGKAFLDIGGFLFIKKNISHNVSSIRDHILLTIKPILYNNPSCQDYPGMDEFMIDLTAKMFMQKHLYSTGLIISSLTAYISGNERTLDKCINNIEKYKDEMFVLVSNVNMAPTNIKLFNSMLNVNPKRCKNIIFESNYFKNLTEMLYKMEAIPESVMSLYVFLLESITAKFDEHLYKDHEVYRFTLEMLKKNNCDYSSSFSAWLKEKNLTC